MRIDKCLPGLALAAILGTALIGCERHETPATRTDLGLPALPSGRFGVPPAPGGNGEQPVSPGSGGSFDPHRPPAPRLILIQT